MIGPLRERRRDRRSYFGADGVPADAIAALQAHPRFEKAMRSMAGAAARLHRGNRLLNTLVNDRGRLVIGYFAIYLHHFGGDDGRDSGLTASRIRALCVEQKVCSGNRAEAVLTLMRLFGYLAAAPAGADRRVRLLVPTERLIASLQQRWMNQFEAIKLVLPEGQQAIAALARPEFTPAFVGELTDHFLAGFRFLEQAPDLKLFADRNAGLMVLFDLISSGARGDVFPPRQPVSVSISGLAGRFGVSRSHVRKLLRDAEKAGLLDRLDPQDGRIVLSARLAEAIRTFIATALLFLAHCARAAIDEIGFESAAWSRLDATPLRSPGNPHE